MRSVYAIAEQFKGSDLVPINASIHDELAKCADNEVAPGLVDEHVVAMRPAVVVLEPEGRLELVNGMIQGDLSL